MERITYFRIFGFLAFVGSVFSSTSFHYPVFTIFWFVAMILFMSALAEESSELTISAFTALAYIPLGLISLLGDYLSKTPALGFISEFALLLVILLTIELILAIVWLESQK